MIDYLIRMRIKFQRKRRKVEYSTYYRSYFDHSGIVLHYPTRDLLRKELSLFKAGSHYLHYHLKPVA